MRILALEPYHGGSHKAFLDGWIAHSRHDWTVIGLPPFKWKWRMRHAAITLADDVRARQAKGERWDALFCSDMLNLAEFVGLVPAPVRDIPRVVYFHENQLTYPVRCETERDYHFALTNITTALAATRVWFNSAFHRDAFLTAIPAFLKRMPDYQPFDAPDRIRAKSDIRYPGIDIATPAASATAPRSEPAAATARDPASPTADEVPAPAQPLHILWAARWEHDKNPDDFFAALELLEQRGAAFRISVIGEQFRDAPPVFEQARRRFADRIVHWGYQPTRDDYLAVLADADVIVSTANHEFFGISVVEAVAAGARPLLPRRLAYPELFAGDQCEGREGCFYDGTVKQLGDKLEEWCEHHARGASARDANAFTDRAAGFAWSTLAPSYDHDLPLLAHGNPVAS